MTAVEQETNVPEGQATKDVGVQSQPSPEKGSPPHPGGHLARSVVSVTIAGGLRQTLALVREILTSAFYGTSGAFSAFSIAFEIPQLLQGLVGEGALSASLLPALVEREEAGDRKAVIALISRAVMLVTVGLTVITIAFVLVAPTLVPAVLGSGFSKPTQDLTVALSQLLFPTVILLGAQSVAVAVLNSENRFTLPAYAPVAWNVVVIVGLVLLRPAFSSDNGIYAYAVAVLVATVVQLVWLLPGLKLFHLRAAWRQTSENVQVRRLLIRMAPVALVAGAWQGDFVTNLLVGSLVGEQVPRAIQAAQRLSMVGFGLMSLAIATVAYPTFRRQVIRGQRAAMADLIDRTVRANLALLIPIAALVVVVAAPATAVVYQRGKFGPDSTELVSTALTWLILGLPAVGMYSLLTKVCFAADRYWPPAGIASGGLLLNLALSLWWQASLGITGIALATTVSFTVVAIVFAAYVHKVVVPYAVRPIVRSTVVLTMVAAVAAGAAAGCVEVLQPRGNEGFGANVLSLVVTAVVGGGLYALGVRVAAPRDAALLTSQLSRAIPWRRRNEN